MNNQLLAFLAFGLLSTLSSLAQSSAFTYQGRLNDSGQPATGVYDLRFTIYDALSGGTVRGGPVNKPGTPVTNGLFMVTLDFGAGAFDGANRWLDIAAGTNGAPVLTPLAPRQSITATPYAVRAANFSGTVGDGQLSANVARLNSSPAFTGAVTAGGFTGSGAGLTNVNASLLGGVAVSNLWKLGGNAGTLPGTHFVGTTDDRPLEVKVNGQRALRLEIARAGNIESLNVIAGFSGNIVSNGVFGGTIAGGGRTGFENRVGNSFATIGGGIGHTAYGNGATIGGGVRNLASGDNATVNGGSENTASGHEATIGGGTRNMASGTVANIGGGTGNTNRGDGATIGGGMGNTATTNHSTVAGGWANAAVAVGAAIGGGAQNTVGGEYGTVPGGGGNTATSYAFAAGRRARASYSGSFVWGDATDAEVNAYAANSVTMRASGGYYFYSNPTLTSGAFLPAGGGAWSNMSDRESKEDFAEVSAREILEKLAALPVRTWKYKSQDAAIRHLGPVAQDFHAAFGVGETNICISTVDADGVALAAIQGLNEKVEGGSQKTEASIRTLQTKLEQKETEITNLKQRLSALEKLLSGLNAKGN